MVIWNQPAIYPPCQRIRTALNVYGENVCKIIPIDRPAFGHVVAVCVGASMAGSIFLTGVVNDTHDTVGRSLVCVFFFFFFFILCYLTC